jgi:hypothetical protein
VIARIDVHLVREPVKRRNFAVGTRLEDRQFTDMDRADAIALGLELGQGGAGSVGSRARGVRLGRQRRGLDGEAGRQQDRRAPGTARIEVTRNVGRCAPRGSIAAQARD